MLTGSLGMLPSASLGEMDSKTKKRKALYEPVHGSTPDIADKSIANPIAMIASFGMALRYSFDLGKQADMIEQAIAATLARGLRTADIKRRAPPRSPPKRWARRSWKSWRSWRPDIGLSRVCSAACNDALQTRDLASAELVTAPDQLRSIRDRQANEKRGPTPAFFTFRRPSADQ